MTEGLGYVIELSGHAAGLVVKEGNRFRFYAAEKIFAGLEQTLYCSPGDAEDACRRLAASGQPPRGRTPTQGSFLRARAKPSRTSGRMSFGWKVALT